MAQQTLNNGELGSIFRGKLNDNYGELYVRTNLSAQQMGDITSTTFLDTVYSRTFLPTAATIRMHSTVNCWIAFGDVTVTASSTNGIAFSSGTEILKRPAASTHVAVRGMTSSGVLNMTGVDTVQPLYLGDTTQLAYTSVSANVAIPNNNGQIRMFAPTDCYFLFGTSSGVTASTSTATYFRSGTETLKVPATATHIALVEAATSGSANITGMN